MLNAQWVLTLGLPPVSRVLYYAAVLLNYCVPLLPRILPAHGATLQPADPSRAKNSETCQVGMQRACVTGPQLHEIM